MMRKTPWAERRFEESMPAAMFPNLLERLRGTPARLEDRLRGVPSERLRRSPGEGWSIQENIGHLILAEALWGGRLDDFTQRLERMRPVPPRDWATSFAPYSALDAGELLAAFRQARERLVRRLEGLSGDDLAHAAIHPRLDRTMTIPDLMLFAAEHDDHHLATITELMRQP